jgi:3-oxoacyl-[acyl-carrier-protein] synthase II
MFVNKRVAVTGIGVVSPVGNTPEEVWKAVSEGKSGVGPITRFDATTCHAQIAAEIKDLSFLDDIPIKQRTSQDKVSLYAMIAARNAWKDSCTPDNRPDAYINLHRVGVVIGSSMGAMEIAFKHYDRFVSTGRVDSHFNNGSQGMIAASVSMDLKIEGPSFTVSSACASGGHAIGEAFRMIRSGSLDVVVTGGSDNPIVPFIHVGFDTIRALSRDDKYQVFDKNRSGFVLGEGATIFVLEEWEHAQRRGAYIYAEVLGYGTASSSMSVVQSDADSAYDAMRLALQSAGIQPINVDYINAHGTGTIQGDEAEMGAIEELFPSGFGPVIFQLVSSTKPVTGHMQGAAGAIEALISIGAIQHNYIPPTINVECLDSKFNPSKIVCNEGMSWEVNTVLSNSFGFGGFNVSLVFGRNK